VVEAAVSRRRSRLAVVWLVLAVMVVVIAALEYADRRGAGSAATGDVRWLLPAPLDELAAVEVADAGRLHRFERDAAGVWLYHGVHTGGEAAHTHAPDPVLAARIQRTLAAFGRTRIERQFPLGGDGTAYGLGAPDVVVLVYGPGRPQPLAQYAVGHVAPDTASRYVLRVGRPVVVTIAAYQVDNLLALVRETAAMPGAGTGAGPSGSRR
jgi:hypothetical protein